MGEPVRKELTKCRWRWTTCGVLVCVSKVLWEKNGSGVACAVCVGMWKWCVAGMASSWSDSDRTFNACCNKLQAGGVGKCDAGVDMYQRGRLLRKKVVFGKGLKFNNGK